MPSLFASALLRLEQVAFELPGTPLWPEGKPYDSLVFTRAQGRYWLELAPGEASDPDLVGDLVVQCELDDGRIESVLLGRRPPPEPFSNDDLPELRRGSDELRLLLGADTVASSQLGLTRDAVRASVRAGVDLQLLAAVAEAVAALRKWPAKAAVEHITQVVDIVHGTVDEPMTFRLAAAGRIAMYGGTPVMSARRVMRPRPWQSARVAVAAREGAAEVRKALPRLALAESLETIARVAQPTHRRLDLPPSGWPWKFRRLWNLLLLLLSSQRAPGAGRSHLPLQRCWALYQDWATFRLIEALVERLGPFNFGGVQSLPGNRPARPRGETPSIGWVTAKDVIDLWVEPTIGSRGAPEHIVDIYGGQLTPDILVVRRPLAGLQPDGSSPPDQITTLLVDQKRYSGFRDSGAISHGNAAVNAGKYLWALRRRASADERAVDHVVLISPGGGGVYVEEARTSVIAAKPQRTDEFASLAGRVTDL